MNRCGKLRRIGAMIASAALLAGTAFAASEEPCRALLSWTGDPTATMTFTWRDDGPKEATVQVVPDARYRESGFAQAMEFSAVSRDVSLDGSGVWHYEATAVGLEPGVTYVYRVGGGDVWSAVETFTTSGTDASTLTFAYLGDAQPANDTAAEVVQWGDLLEAMYERNPELSFAVLGGDNVNSGISLDQFELFSENAARVFSSVPLFSTIGNHESNFIGGKAELLLDWFAFPENGPEGFEEEFYSFDVANCHILVLNSWIFSGEQPLTDEDYERVNNWIAADLARSRADWQVAVTHIPVYAVHSDTTAAKVKENWVPIFEQYGVDLVFEGHQHVYSRSYPMYQGKIDYENGITYIMGVSGSKQYDSADETFAARTVYSTPNYQLIQIDGDMLTVQSLDPDGNELDFLSVMQREVSVTRGEYIETLWRAAGAPEPAGSSPFADTDAPAVVWAYENGIILGCGNGTFRPGDRVAGWQIDLILGRMSEQR